MRCQGEKKREEDGSSDSEGGGEEKSDGLSFKGICYKTLSFL